jgi:lipoprotein NlpD
MRKPEINVAVVFLILLCIISCAGPPVKPENVKGVYHRIKRGETLWSISKTYHVKLQEIAELNNITNPAEIEVDSVIFIPGADRILDVTPTREKREVARTVARTAKQQQYPKPVVEQQKEDTPVEPTDHVYVRTPAFEETGEQAIKTATKKFQDKSNDQDRIEFDRNRFTWPVRGTIQSRFGIQQNGLKNNGIRIAAKEGTPVLAAAAGEVTYSDKLKYYGETIILRHDENFSTVYTSLKNRAVKVGDRVKKGDKVAFVGSVENGDGPSCLNFEIRQANKPRNPLFFLPP